MDKLFRQYTERVLASIYGTSLIFFSVASYITNKKLRFDYIVMMMIGLVLISLFRYKYFYQKFKIYDLVWYTLILSSATWQILKVFLLNDIYFTFILGLFGLFIGLFKIEKKKHFVLLTFIYLIFLVTCIFNIDHTMLEKSSYLLLFSILFIVSYYLKYTTETKSKNDVRSLQGIILANASEAFAVHEIIFDDKNNACDYKFTMVNASFEKLTGLKRVDILGRLATEVLPGLEKHWIDTYTRVACEFETIKFMNYSGDLNKHFQVSAFPVSYGKFATLFLDVTDRIINEKELEENRNRLEQMSHDKSEFIKAINHQIRTPLNGLNGALQLYIEEKDDELLEHIALETKHINTIINKVSMFVDVQDTNYIFKKATIEDDIQLLMNTYDTDYKLINKLGEKKLIMYDSDIFKKIFKVIMSNAIDYGRNKPVIVSYELVIDNESRLLISIKDHGSGMNKDMINSLLDPFSVDTIMINKPKHLTLAQCKLVLDNAGGSLKIDSGPDMGTTITIELPHKII